MSTTAELTPAVLLLQLRVLVGFRGSFLLGLPQRRLLCLGCLHTILHSAADGEKSQWNSGVESQLPGHLLTRLP